MTRLTSAVQQFSRPRYQGEGPVGSCVIGGTDFSWTNCTPAAFAMALDATTAGKRRPTPCSIRRDTHDTSGGTNLRQNADVMMSRYGIFVATYTGKYVLTPQRVAALVKAGHKVVVQGNADAMLGTTFRSTAGAVNHAATITDVRGWTANSEPAEALMWDPAADGRKRAYHIDQGPSWWPWSLVKTFAAHLRPDSLDGGKTGTRLGPGKVYAAVFPDSEPHVSLLKGAIRTNPFPDRTRAAYDGVRIHSGLSSASKVLYTVTTGVLLVGYQIGVGSSHKGDKHWLGNDDGTEWVHVKNLTHFGGST